MTYYISLILIVLFLGIPLFAAYHYKTGMHRHIISAFSKMLLRLGILSICTYYIIVWNNIFPAILFTIPLIGYTAITILVKARLRMRTYIIPISAGTFISVAFISACLSPLIIVGNNNLNIGYLLPIFAIIANEIVEGLSKSLSMYYSGLRNHNQLYYYLLYNGASSSEALQYLKRRAIKKAFVPNILKTASMGVSMTPVIMWAMIMCGENVINAFLFQLTFTLGTMSGTIIATIVSIYVAHHYIVDDYGKIVNTPTK